VQVRISKSTLAGAVATCAAAAAIGASGAAGAAGAAGASGAGAARLSTDRGCYLVGQPVSIRGVGFAPARTFTVTVDGVFFGKSTTDSGGTFSTSLRPGGLGANVPQQAHHIEASDGTTTADTKFTVTRKPGARFLATTGNPNTLRSPFQVWGFSTAGAPLAVFLHYVSPSGGARQTVSLGNVGGQCGYLETKRLRVFPFKPSAGSWTLQVDTDRRYSRRPSGPVARIGVRIG
jgi:hypothetical protein